MEQLKDFFKKIEINSIVDAGTGTGDFIAVLNEVFPNSEISGFDPNSESIAIAKEKYPKIKFFEMGVESIDFEDSTFDLASISMALHHVPDVQNSLKELQRLVKPGGWIIVNELYSDNLNQAQVTHKLYHHFRSKIDRLIGVSHNETFKKDEIIKMVKDSGIGIKLHFKNHIKRKEEDSKVLEERIEKMNLMLEKIKHLPDYNLLLPEIDVFKDRVLKYGFQSPPRVVIVGQAL